MRGDALQVALGAIVLIVFGLAGKLISDRPGRLAARRQHLHDDTTLRPDRRAGVLGGFAALYYWFPKLCGRLMGDALGGPPSGR